MATASEPLRTACIRYLDEHKKHCGGWSAYDLVELERLVQKIVDAGKVSLREKSSSYRMLDLFCGQWGWSRAFTARGWECVGVDLVEPNEVPARCEFVHSDILFLDADWLRYTKADFICASPPCEQFSVHGLKMWHKAPPFPCQGITLFDHTLQICMDSGIPYVIENVRSAEQFVGPAVAHCGPFYLWGNSVPPLLPKGITKGSMIWSKQYRNMGKAQRKREVSTIPLELAACVADYATRICSEKVCA